MIEDITVVEKNPKAFYESWTFVILVCVILPICFRAVLIFS
jgi:hypothetical protein